jgi:CubicO group peptidase (beta-lactamase class C family)
MEKDWPRVSDVIPPPDFATTLRIKSDNGLLEKVVTNPNLDPWLANTAEWRRADLSAANGHGNSRSLARMLSLISLGGKLTGCERLLSEKTIDLIFEEQANGIDLVIGAPLRRGLGYGLAPTVIMNWLPEGRICYWLGLGGSFVVMDLDRRMTIAYAMNKMAENGAVNERLEEYGEAIYEALAGAD